VFSNSGYTAFGHNKPTIEFDQFVIANVSACRPQLYLLITVLNRF